MKKELVEKLKEKMLAKRDELVTSISNRNAEVSELNTDSEPGDEIDVAAFAVDGYLLNQLGARDVELLNQINGGRNDDLLGKGMLTLNSKMNT